MKLVDWLVLQVKKLMSVVAGLLNMLSGGLIRPWHVTLLSLLGHGLVVWALVANRPIVAGVLIAVFGLMDSLDGALARLQKRASLAGMFLDAVTDRAKETLIYTGLAVFMWQQGDGNLAWLAVAVGMTSLLVSYAKAKGEMAVSGIHTDKQRLNRIFSDGLGRYEIRMFVLIAGLVAGFLVPALLVLLSLNIATAVWRFAKIMKALNYV